MDLKGTKSICLLQVYLHRQDSLFCRSGAALRGKMCKFSHVKQKAMKPVLFFFFFVLTTSFLHAQTVPYNVVFDLTSSDTNDHKSVIRWISGISQDRPEAKLEVVLYGQSLGMVQKDKSAVAPAIQQLLQNKNISVKVCAAAMKRHNIDASQLLPGIGIVPDGIYEIITRQKEGWGYIKAAH
jgi:hypothetical protein